MRALPGRRCRRSSGASPASRRSRSIWSGSSSVVDGDELRVAGTARRRRARGLPRRAVSAATTRRIALPIDGMTCAACAARDRAHAQPARRRAGVGQLRDRAGDRRLRPGPRDAVVARRGGRGHRLRRAAARTRRPRPRRPGRGPAHAPRRLRRALRAGARARDDRRRPQFGGWQWLALALATPVVLWGGWPFHRAAWANLRHRAATMDTLVSLGTLAAWGWSVVTIAFLGAGRDGADDGRSA